ncbi:proteasome subunit alpha [Saccharothrix coeruleofusca]|uniref:Proteasome subunit alpha n=1 Tax=Saccharothrix coeruleofusca TaxID=33919 RepID=A0A918EHQ8_9PSEU|nr:proteasome subunit alpha [Saccharothrix coeruleofusca]MBP2336979.1 proteasome alpha subunit [Saccharothrix coeruleofusca]GGP84078.1 proteasome subunit alpha [Saccharothrix coeruleofusca]
MTLPLYASPEQILRDRSEYARKGIARGRSVVVLRYADGVLFVAENPSSTLHKVSEIYDRIGFAAVGRYSEFENLRQAGIRFADVRGYQNDPRDVTGRSLANVYAQTLGSIFTQEIKPLEVEICVAEVGHSAEEDTLYRLTYDGSIVEEPQYVVMGGQAEATGTALKESYAEGLALADAVRLAVKALSNGSTSTGNGKPDLLDSAKLEVAVLERDRPRRAFRRIVGAALAPLLPTSDAAPAEPEAKDEGKSKPVTDASLPPDDNKS